MAPLHIAVEKGYYEIVKYIVEYSETDVNEKLILIFNVLNIIYKNNEIQSILTLIS